MAHSANIVDFPVARRVKSDRHWHPPVSPLARLVPGISNVPASAEITETLTADKSLPFPGQEKRSWLNETLAELTPKYLEKFEQATVVAVSLDFVLIVSAFAGVKAFLSTNQMSGLGWRELAVYIASFLIFAQIEGLYLLLRRRVVAESCALARTVLVASVLASIASQHLSLPSVLALFAFGVGSSLLVAIRKWLERSLRREIKSKHILVVGSGARAQKIIDAIRRDPDSDRILKGVIAENHLRNIYGPAMLGRIAREEFIDEIVIASDDPVIVQAAVEEARRNRLDIRFAPEIPAFASGMQIETVGGIPWFRVRDHRVPEYMLAVKRLLDICIACLGLVLSAPLFIAIAALIKLDTPGPALYSAMRIGRKKRHFRCYKFRTMIQDADAVKDKLRSRNERDGASFKLRDDPRVTRIGGFLRRYSLDELPQLWNVLVGDMSLVGPRPHPVDDVNRYHVHHMQRLDFVPGITGLWQVMARQDPSFERNVALDVDYIKRWSLWLDLKILWRTILVVLEGTGV
ncbi:MAG TPA: sugar transferase [Terriglobales bacterium]|nr:sugar transferase [Terriglobales bacterium]